MAEAAEREGGEAEEAAAGRSEVAIGETLEEEEEENGNFGNVWKLI